MLKNVRTNIFRTVTVLKMKISVVGAGYVGLCTAIGFAMKGNDVVCIDIDKNRVDKIKSGIAPFYEYGVEENLKKCISKGLLSATTEFDSVRDTDITFICVGTPSKADGSADLGYVKSSAGEIGKAIKGYHVVAVKSTVIPGTTEETVIPIIEKSSGKKAGKGFGVAMNPEFLKEGFALRDFLTPDRIVVGELDKRSGDVLESLYRDFGAPVIRTRLKSAEMIKYAANAFLASKISLINEIGNICKKLGIDIYEVAKGIGYDKRIGNLFLNAGAGFGGSCFTKDMMALAHKSRELGYEPRILEEVLNLNKTQRMRMVELLKKRLQNLENKKIAVLGLSFKPGTDDTRDAISIDIIGALLKEGCKISCYDPRAMENMKKIFPEADYAPDAVQALKSADACLVLTEWDEFKSLKDKDFGAMKRRIIIEGRKVLENVSGSEGICW